MSQQMSVRPRRGGFTIIELLVVIAIIGVLVGILIPAVQAVRERAKHTQAAADVSQLSVAIGTAKDTMTARYVPSFLNVKPTYIYPVGSAATSPDGREWLDIQQFFGPRFGTSTVAANTVHVSASFPFQGPLNGNQCLVFLLGGTHQNGFSSNAANPFDGTAPKRGPFFDFPEKRLDNSGPVPQFLDPWNNPFFYFSARNGNDYDQYNNAGVTGILSGDCMVTFFAYPGAPHPTPMQVNMRPFREGGSGRYVKPDGFQIVSAGTNGGNPNYLNPYPAPNSNIYYGGPGGPWTPGTGSYNGATASFVHPNGPWLTGGDDIASFYDKMLGAP